MIYPYTVLQNNATSIEVDISPYLEVTSVTIESSHIALGLTSFNLTSTSGLVNATLTSWEPNIDSVAFTIHNTTLADVSLWMTCSKPSAIYIDDVIHLEGDGWSWNANILSMDVTGNPSTVNVIWGLSIVNEGIIPEILAFLVVLAVLFLVISFIPQEDPFGRMFFPLASMFIFIILAIYVTDIVTIFDQPVLQTLSTVVSKNITTLNVVTTVVVENTSKAYAYSWQPSTAHYYTAWPLIYFFWMLGIVMFVKSLYNAFPTEEEVSEP